MIFFLFLSCLDNDILTTFISLWEYLFCCEDFSFAVRIFFCCKNFSLAVRILILLWESKMFGQPCKKALVDSVACTSCCNQDLFVVQSIWIVQLKKTFTEKKGFSRLCSLCLVSSARFHYSPEYNDNLEKRRLQIVNVSCSWNLFKLAF